MFCWTRSVVIRSYGSICGFLKIGIPMSPWLFRYYPLVNVYKKLWKDPPFLMVEIHYQWQFPIVMLVYQRVKYSDFGRFGVAPWIGNHDMGLTGYGPHRLLNCFSPTAPQVQCQSRRNPLRHAWFIILLMFKSSFSMKSQPFCLLNTIWLWLTVRHGKSTIAIIGKPVNHLFLWAIYTMANCQS